MELMYELSWKLKNNMAYSRMVIALVVPLTPYVPARKQRQKQVGHLYYEGLIIVYSTS
jgi:hypothetical protein